MIERLRLAIAADLDQVPGLAAAFERWADQAGLSAREVNAANLAIEELVVNVITHGLRGGPGTIMLMAQREPSCLAIELRDGAPAFDPFQADMPDLESGVEARPVGGLGVHFVRTLMDCWSYTREGNENVVRLLKTLNEAAPRKEDDELG